MVSYDVPEDKMEILHIFKLSPAGNFAYFNAPAAELLFGNFPGLHYRMLQSALLCSKVNICILQLPWTLVSL